MALTDHALVTVSTVETELGLTPGAQDALLQRLINSVSEQIKNYCNREFYYEVAREDKVRAYGLTRLTVEKSPIVTLTSIEYDGATIDSDNYEIEDASQGIIYRPDGWLWTASRLSNIERDRLPGTEGPDYDVTYNGGYITQPQEDDSVGTRSLPYDLEDAALQLISLRYKKIGEDIRMKSEKLMSYSYTYSDGLESEYGIPKSIATMLNAYRRFPQA